MRIRLHPPPPATKSKARTCDTSLRGKDREEMAGGKKVGGGKSRKGEGKIKERNDENDSSSLLLVSSREEDTLSREES